MEPGAGEARQAPYRSHTQPINVTLRKKWVGQLWRDGSVVKSLVAHTCNPALGKQRQEYPEVKARIGGKDRERRGEKKKGEERRRQVRMF